MVPRNKLSIISNSFQGNSQRVLCVCSGGVLRSPTAAWILGNEPFNFNTRSCGDKDYALIPLTEELVMWADEIVVMDSSQALSVNDMLVKAIPESGATWPLVHTLNIEDDFDFKDPVLVECMTRMFKELFL